MCKCNIPASIIKDIVGWENVSMVDLYDDTEVDDELGKYFNADGIKMIEKKDLSDL
jgi:chorismate mutase